MKKIVLVLAALFFIFVIYRVVVNANRKNTIRNRLESALSTYPDYMTVTYKDASSLPGCSSSECEPRMEITFGSASVTKAEQDLSNAIIKQGYAKSGGYDFNTTDGSKLCQTIHIRPAFNDKSKIVLLCY